MPADAGIAFAVVQHFALDYASAPYLNRWSEGNAKKLSRDADDQDANGILDDNLTRVSPLLTTS
jgi:hypothetical protein